MSTRIEVARVARNNAAWCDAVARAHGLETEFAASHWRSLQPMPRFYPNLVTLDESNHSLEAIEELRAKLAPGWAIKDSYGSLRLAGLRPLFDAEWITRSSSCVTGSTRLRWIRLGNPAGIARWEAAWGESAGEAPIFRTELLAHADVAILAGTDSSGEVLAGVIANTAAGCVGLSNFFARADRTRLRAESCAAAEATFPGLQLVGYEAGEDLAACRSLGFESLGRLRVLACEKD